MKQHIAIKELNFQRVRPRESVQNNWAAARENLSSGVSSLISAFVIRLFKSIISILATGEISIFWLVFVAEETGLNLALSETPKTGFLATRPI